jgi:hypothetical protein
MEHARHTKRLSFTTKRQVTYFRQEGPTHNVRGGYGTVSYAVFLLLLIPEFSINSVVICKYYRVGLAVVAKQRVIMKQNNRERKLLGLDF